jgi:hypothetical protein
MQHTPASPSRSLPPRRKLALLALLAIPAVVAVGCSSDDVAEELAEQGLGEGSDVSIDSESGDVSIKTEDGEIASSSGKGTKLPEAWPSDIPMPEDYTLTTAMSMGAAPELGFNLTGDVPDAVAAFDEVTTAFAAQGWTELQKSIGDYGEGTMSSATYEKGERSVAFSTMYVPGDDINTFSYTSTVTTD